MASVLAIVSKRAFETEARVGGRLVGPGDVWPTGRYESAGAALRKLEGGGHLFLVTVRPGDEPWLVAVLSAPRFDGTRWTATPNTRPVTPLGALLPRLTLASGSGVSAPPGKLGMALQTPRELSDADVALLLGAAGAAAPAPAPDPGDPVADARALAAPHLAADALAALDAAVVQARKAPGRAVRAFKDAAKALGKGLPQVRVADWGAEAVRDAGKGAEAMELFRLARRTERSANVPVADRADAARWARFAGLSSFDPELLALGVAALDADTAADLVVRSTLAANVLAGAACAALPPDRVPGVIRAVADRTASADAAFWERFGAVAAAAAPPGWVLSARPAAGPFVAWRAAVDAAGGPASPPPGWFDALRSHAADLLSEEGGGAWLESAARASGSGPVVVGAREPLDLVDVWCASGRPVVFAEGSGLDLWRHPTRPLTALAAHPDGLDRVARAVEALQDTDHPGGGGALAALALVPALRPVFDRFAARLAAARTVATLEELAPPLDRIALPAVFAAVPSLAEAVRGLDPAALLQGQLRAGSMDEWVWPAQEETSERHGHDAPQYDTDGPFPNWVTTSARSGRLVVAGPGGVVLDVPFAPAEGERVRTMRYVDGDVLVFTLQANLRTGRWLSRPEQRFELELYTTWGQAVAVPGGGVTEGGPAYGPGDTHAGGPGGVLSDGTRFWRGEEAFDPRTGRSLGRGRPTFFDGSDVPAVRAYFPVPPEAAGSPLGVRDGQYAFRATALGGGRYRAENGAGAVWEGPSSDPPRALFRFPERDGVYPVVHRSRPGELCVRTPDGQDAVVPAVNGGMFWFWRGAPQWLPLAWWHLLRPRDPAASRALAACPLDAARALLDAADPDDVDDGPGEVAGVEGSVTFALTPAAARAAERPAVAAAIGRVLPEVRDPRLVAGVGAIAHRAARLRVTIERWVAAAAEPPGAEGRTDEDFAALAALYGPGWSWGRRDLEAQVRATDTWFASGPDDGHKTPPQSRLPWEVLAIRERAIAFRAAAPGTPDDAREQLRALLGLWRSTALRGRRLRLVGLGYDRYPVADQSLERGDLLLADRGHKWLLRLRDMQGKPRFTALELAGPDGFAVPPGARLEWAQEAEPPADGDVTVPIDPAAARATSAETGLLSATALRLLTGSLGPWTPSPAVRKALGLTVADVELSDREREELEGLYQAAWPDPGRLGALWVARFGRRSPMAAELVRKLVAELRTDGPTLHHDLRAVEAPDEQPFLVRDERWVIRPWRGFQSNVSYMAGWIPPGWPKHASQGAGEERPDAAAAFSGWVLRRFLRLVPWAHLELPVGDRHRAGIARLTELVEARLENPHLLLLAGAVDLSNEADPARLAADFAALRSRFEGRPYAGEGVARGIDRGDVVVTFPSDVENALFVAFRPARLGDPAALARLADDLGFREVFQRTGGGCTCGLNFGRHRVVDFTDLAPWLVWRSEGFQRLVRRLRAPDLPDGAFEADPRVSAPEAVARAASRHGLDGEAATLWLQLAALPEPTPERLRRVNGWTAATLKRAESALLARGLAHEGKHPGSPRTLWTGPVTALRAPAATMESSKLALYGLEAGASPPFGVVLPLRPLAELFSAVAPGAP